MEKKCPRCGKIMKVSAEELEMHGGVVVCSQCLAVYDMSGNVHDSSDQGPVRTMSQAEAEAAASAGYHYCPDCGRTLPDGVKFCPYCGIRLAAQASPAEVQEQEKPQESKQAPQAVTTKTPERRHTVLPSLQHYRARKWGVEPASLRARVAGFSVIAVLLAVLAFIVYQGMLISE